MWALNRERREMNGGKLAGQFQERLCPHSEKLLLGRKGRRIWGDDDAQRPGAQLRFFRAGKKKCLEKHGMKDTAIISSQVREAAPHRVNSTKKNWSKSWQKGA